MGGGGSSLSTSIISNNPFRKPWDFMHHLDVVIAGIIVIQLIISSVSSVSLV